MKLFAFIFVCVCLAGAVYGAAIPEDYERVATNVTVVSNIQDYLSEHPSVRLIPLSRTSLDSVNLDSRDNSQYSIVYSAGQRVKGDEPVARASDGHKGQSLSDISITLQYPEEGYCGQGAVVTYVHILVDQTGSSNGNAYIQDGGIGQRYVKIVIEANGVSAIKFDTTFFGIH